MSLLRDVHADSAMVYRENPLDNDGHNEGKGSSSTKQTEKEVDLGGMSRRLSQMTDESLEQGGHGLQKSIEEGGFSDELKKALQARIQESSFKRDNAAAFAEANMPVRFSPAHTDLYE